MSSSVKTHCSTEAGISVQVGPEYARVLTEPEIHSKTSIITPFCDVLSRYRL